MGFRTQIAGEKDLIQQNGNNIKHSIMVSLTQNPHIWGSESGRNRTRTYDLLCVREAL